MYPQVFGKYILERELSRGGMARVLLATLRGAGGFEKKLVVKQIRDELAFDDDFTRRFVEEAKTTVALSHPNIVPVYELGVEQGVYYLAMELVEGASLAELIGKGQKLSPDEGAYVGVEVCRALDYAHRKMQVVHRDITPRNVMIDEEGQVKIIDFGIAARVREMGLGKVQVFGSPGHMPSEQMRGDSIGPAADVFAVGALLIEAWSGRSAFRRKTIEEVEAALAGPLPKPSDSDPRLIPIDDVITRALAFNPDDRPQQAEELGRSLRKFLTGSDTGDLSRSLGERVRAARKKAENARERDSWLANDSAARPASVPDLGTRTFAIRDELKSFSDHGELSGVLSEPKLETRKLISVAPPSEIAIETLATKPIETPVNRAPRVTSTKVPPGRALRWSTLAFATVLVGGGSFLYFAKTKKHPQVNAVTPVVSVGPAPIQTLVVPTSVPSSVVTTASVTLVRDAGLSETLPSQNTPVKQAHLALYGDPGTRVRVDGAPWSACPVRDFAIDAGEHDVRFFFDATGESSGKRIKLHPAEHVSLRADFTTAVPTISLSH